MKKLRKILTLLLIGTSLGLSLPFNNTYNKISADEPFDGDKYIKDIHDTYTVTDTMITSDMLKDITTDDLFVLGPNSSKCACVLQYDGIGFYLGDKQHFDEWAIFRLHVEELDPQVPEQYQCTHFYIEMLSDPYDCDNYNPHYLNVFHDMQIGRDVIGLTNDPDPLKSTTYFQINDSYIYGTNYLCSSGYPDELIYSPLNDEEWYREFEGVLVDVNSSNLSPDNNFGFFKIIPAARVTYDPNGGNEEAYSKVTKWHEKVEDCSFTFDKKCFVGWNEHADGSGQAHEVGEDLTLVTSITLYAQWADNPIYEIEDIAPMFSLAYKYTYTTQSSTFTEITSLEELEDYDELILVAEYNGNTYAMNSSFEGEEIIINNNQIKPADNQNINNVIFRVDKEDSIECIFLWVEDYMMYIHYNNTLGLSKGTGNGFEIATYNGGTYLGDDADGNELNSCLICKDDTNKLTFMYAEKTNIGTDGWCSSCKLYARHTNPFSDVDFRVRVGINVYDYIEEVQSFVAPTFDSAKFTDYGFDLVLKEREWNYIITQKTYSFVNNDLVYKNEQEKIQYINLIFGDCLAKNYRDKLDLSIEITPYVIYDGMKIKSNKKRSYTIREMLEVYYKDNSTKEIVAPLYNILETFKGE